MSEFQRMMFEQLGALNQSLKLQLTINSMLLEGWHKEITNQKVIPQTVIEPQTVKPPDYSTFPVATSERSRAAIQELMHDDDS